MYFNMDVAQQGLQNMETTWVSNHMELWIYTNACLYNSQKLP